MSAGFFTACERLLSAAANGVYQGILVAAIAGLALRLFPRTNAATRHAVWFGVLLFVTALIPAHLLVSRLSRHETPATPIQPALGVMTFVLPPIDDTAASPDSKPDSSDSVVGEPPTETAREDFSANSRPEPVAAEKTGPRFAPAILNALSGTRERAISLPHWLSLCLICAWALLASVRAGLIFRRIGEVRCVKNSSALPSQKLQTLFDRLRDSLAARRGVRLRISGTHRAAVVLGFVHPVVLLPAEMDSYVSDDEVEHVMRHELAHVVRSDDWANLAQQIVQAALFFHPAVWWISAKLSLEREIACDDHVLEASGQPRAYALTLANIASRMKQCRHLLAPGVSNNKSQLQQRITMILNTHRNRSPRLATSRLGILTTATAILAVLAIGAGPRLVLAQSSSSSSDSSGTVSVALPPAPNAPTAEVSPATQPPDEATTESGPIPKPPVVTSIYPPGSQPLQLIAPASGATVSVTPAMPSMPELASADSAPDVAPVPPEPPAPRAPRRHMSVEERLDRIERILEDLQTRDGAKFRHRSSDGNSSGAGQSWAIAPNAMAVNPNFDFQFKRAAEEAQRAAEQAQRAMEAGQRAAEKAFRDSAKSQSRDMEQMQDKMADMKSQVPLKELQALRDARDSLRREMENLERQIKHIEQEQNRPKDSNHGRSDKPDDGQNQAQPAPE